MVRERWRASRLPSRARRFAALTRAIAPGVGTYRSVGKNASNAFAGWGVTLQIGVFDPDCNHLVILHGRMTTACVSLMLAFGARRLSVRRVHDAVAITPSARTPRSL